MPKKNVLYSLEGKKLNGFTINVNNVSKGRFIEESDFELHLKTKKREISKNPVIKGKYFSGRGKNYSPWLEIYYYNYVEFNSSNIDLSKAKIEQKLFDYLSCLLPKGSHIMVVYVNHKETQDGLQLGIPAPITPIGYLLLKSGFTKFKDWYFAEGGKEGDVKLQGEKALSKDNEKKNLEKIKKELVEFLKKEKLFLDAKERAKKFLKK
jgi:hypothetical protein